MLLYTYQKKYVAEDKKFHYFYFKKRNIRKIILIILKLLLLFRQTLNRFRPHLTIIHVTSVGSPLRFP